MRYIFKNYLKTFIKNWIQTLGTILFIMMMVTIVIGMLASPLQISSIVNEYKGKNNNYDSFLNINQKKQTGNFTNQFLYSYVYQNQAFEGKDEHEQTVKIIDKSSNQILSTAYRVSLDRYLASTGASQEVERQNFVGQNLRSAINAYKQGGLIPLKLSLELTDRQGNVNTENKELIINNLADLLVADANLAVNQNYGQNYNNQEILFRLVMKMITLFSNNSLDLDLAKLADKIPDSGNQEIKNDQQMRVVANVILNVLFDMVLEDKPKALNWTLSTFELFSPQLYKILGWKAKDNAAAGIYEDYSYDFNYYVLSQIFNNPSNPNFYKPNKGFRYAFESEKTLYFAENTTDSLFPKFAIELKTMNGPKAVNQLQLEKGVYGTPVRFRDLVNKDRDRAVIPTMVISSAYLNANNYAFNDLIQLPASSARNNLLLINRQPADDFLTGSIPFRLVGTGSKFDDLVPGPKFTPFLENISSFANGYVDDALFSTIRTARWNFSSVNENNFITKFMFKNLWSSSDHVVDQLTINARNGMMVYDTNSLIGFNQSETVDKLNNLEIIVTIFIILGVVVLILSFVFINFIIKKELNETRKQIGIFKSFGYKIAELSWIFAVKTLITIFAGIVVGLITSIPLQLYAIRLYIDGIMFNFSHIYMEPIFLTVLMVVIPLVFLLLSYFLTLQYLREPTLSLLSNGGKVSKWTSKPSWLIRQLSQKNKWFAYRLQRSFIRRSMGKFVVVQILFAFASLSYTLIFGAQTLLYALVNQGFSSLNPNTDHEFGWQNKFELSIPIDDDRFNVSDIDSFLDAKFEYVGFKNDQSVGQALIDNKDTSDSRYRVSALVDSYAREFSASDLRHDEALDLVMPEGYYFDRYVYQPEKNQQFMGKNAIKFIQKDYYLNWIFTLKITELPQGLITDIQNNRIDRHNFTEIKNLYRNNPSIRLDLDRVLAGDQEAIAQLEKEFPKTIFGMKALNENGLKNNVFIEDITKIIILQLAEQNFDAQINSWLTNNAIVQPNGWYAKTDVLKAIDSVKNSELGRDFDPDNQHYWGLMDNPLIDIPSLIGGDGDDEINSPVGGGLSLSKLPPETISLIMSALMLKKEDSEDINQNSVITANELFFNKETEFLAYELRMSNGNRDQTGGNDIADWINLRMFDSQSAEYGQYNNLLSHGGVSEATYKRLGEQLFDEKMINGVIPYGLARTYNVKIGDTFTLLTNTIHQEEIKIKVIGINEDVSFYLGNGWPIDVDYGQFRAKFFNPELNFQFEEGLPLFNKLYSQEPLLTGDINISNISQSINSMKFVGKNLSMSINNNASIFGSVFNGVIDFTRLFNMPVDANFSLVTNPNVASTSRNSVVYPYNILRSGVDNVIGIVNNVLVLFMILLAFLLLIILVVVMNIVIEEAASIILTLRAIGYTNFEVNWIVMGSYIVGALISFVVAYMMSIVIWVVFLKVVGDLTHIYVFMKLSWQAPVVTFLVIGFILFIGWLAANMRVNKTPLSRITNFS